MHEHIRNRNFLQQNSKEIIETQSLDKLYEIFIDLAIRKSELHKLIHFCIDDYERKNYFLLWILPTPTSLFVKKKSEA